MNANSPFSDRPLVCSSAQRPATSGFFPILDSTLQARVTETSVRERLRRDEEARRRVLSEAIASFALEGIQISWEDASRMLDEVLDEPPARLTA